ncbi:hypothetical protein ACFE04_012043 [Oxalis oulophora]
MEKQRLEVVLIPLPFQGHINPMLQLATILYSQGFSITILHTQFNAPNPSNHPHFTFLSIPNGEISPHQEPLDIIISLNTNCRVPLHDQLTSLGQAACIIYDALMHCVDEVANELKIPTIAFRSNSVVNLITNYACVQLEKDGCLPLQDSISLDIVPGFHPLRYKDLPVFNYQNNEGYLHLIAKVQSLKFASAMICNTMEFMEKLAIEKYKQNLQIPFFALGPLHKFAPASSNSLLEEDITCISWLEKQKPKSVLYVSLGSLASMKENELTELAWGLANSEQPFLWVVRPGSVPVWCLGIHYENELERGEVERVVRSLMVSEDGHKMRQRATEFKERAQQCIKLGGSSYISLKKLVEHITKL